MNLAAFRLGAAAWMFTGVVHDILEFVLPGDPELSSALRDSSIHVGPVSLNSESLIRGVSLSMGLAMFVLGLVLWMTAGVLRAAPKQLRAYGIVALAASTAALGLAVLFVPGPPLVTFAVATVSFGVALMAKPGKAKGGHGTQAVTAFRG